ncbi:ligand-binding SRPBCC domain-containing protein [Arthrobacter pigmenti]|uniref:Ligand-binding SRPBCC domain-containing protein n=1 Tax=Arthrobacter pigmenti TaxID=271432 RepID=A0A846RZS4_9MICC|nr:hypothetical protein [Arthrobacter pigmenti]NJC23681.1 ligand-binding SRPBCC domain-containing protein [Arthrobacter pigmenti]
MRLFAASGDRAKAGQPAVRVTRSVVVAAPRDAVWERVTAPAGINHELRPLLSMQMPVGYRHATIATVPVGEWLGKAPLLLGGVLPIEYDDLRLIEVTQPVRFHERSRMRTASVWEHRRELEALTENLTRVTDQLTVVPRLSITAGVLRAFVGALFEHRHRRLRHHFNTQRKLRLGPEAC